MRSGKHIDGAFEWRFDWALRESQSAPSRRVAVQFASSDEDDIVKFSRRLEGSSGAEVFVLGDALRSSLCCDDVLAAARVRPDVILRFGYSCTASRASSALYLFDALVGGGLLEIFSRPSEFWEGGGFRLLLYDWRHGASLGPGAALRDALVERWGSGIVFGEMEADPQGSSTNEVVLFGRRFGLPEGAALGECVSVLWVGSEGEQCDLKEALTLRFGVKLWIVNLVGRCLERACSAVEVSRRMSRRYAMVERLASSREIGILLYLQCCSADVFMAAMVPLMRSVLDAAGVRAFVCALEKPLVETLGNFEKVDAFVALGCPETVLLRDRTDSLQPIASVHELLLALSSIINWKGFVSVDLREALEMLQEASPGVQPPAGGCDAQWCEERSPSCVGRRLNPSSAQLDSATGGILEPAPLVPGVLGLPECYSVIEDTPHHE